VLPLGVSVRIKFGLWLGFIFYV